MARKPYTMTFEMRQYTKKNGTKSEKVVELVSPYLEKFQLTNYKTGESYMGPSILVPCFAIKGSKENKKYHEKLAAEKAKAAKTTRSKKGSDDSSLKPFWM